MDANADSVRTMIKPRTTLLLVASGAAQGTQIAVPAGGLVLGRDGPAQGRLGDDPALSRRHAVIAHSGRGELMVSDLGSANGTFLNGSRVDGSAPVRPGDVIEVGSTKLTAIGPFTGASPAPARPAAGGYGHYPAAAVPEGMYYDQVSGLVLPHGTQLASVGRRIGACFLTLPLPLILLGGFLAWASGWVSGDSRVLQVALITVGLGYLVWGLLAWGQGQSPALQALGMRCWRPETKRVAGWGTMALRETIGRIVDSLFLVTLPVSFLLFLTGKEHKSLHDHIAGTVVVHDPGRVLSR